MLKRTHLAIGLFMALFFLEKVSYKWVFVPVVLISSLLPDVDSMNSYLGKKWFLRPIQWITKHRGLLHSISFTIVVALALSLIWPRLAFPFFLGYGSHLIVDSFTIEGTRPLWPLKMKFQGNIKTGGRTEDLIFVISLTLIVLIMIFMFV